MTIGAWQWPYRGCRIGEASLPGPPMPAIPGSARPEVAGEVNGDLPVGQTLHVPIRMWRRLDILDLAVELRRPVRTVRDPPRWFRAQFR